MLAVFASACSPPNNTPDVVTQDVQTTTDASDAAPAEGGTGCTGTDQFVRQPADPDCNNGPSSMMVPGLVARSCNNAPFCPALVTNTPATPNFMLTQIDIQTPAVLSPTGPIGSLLNAAIVQGTFFWGLSLDFTAMTIRTGAFNNLVAPVANNGFLTTSFSYLNGGAPMMGTDPASTHRWDPVTGTITINGDTVTSNSVAVIRVPVYDSNDPTMILTELPLRNLQMSNVRLSSNRNCVGTVARAPRFGYSTCANSQWNTQDSTMMPYSSLDGDMTVADAQGVVVQSLHQDLCRLLAGADCAMTPQSMWTTHPDRLVSATGSTMACGTTGMPACNAFHLNARFAAVAVTVH